MNLSGAVAFQAVQVNAWWIPLAALVVTALGVFMTWHVSRSNADRLQGALEAKVTTRLDDHDKAIARQEKVNDEQWSEINGLKTDTGDLKAKLSELRGEHNAIVGQRSRHSWETQL